MEAPVPVPLSLMICVEPGAFNVLSVTVSVPLTTPLTVGVKLTINVHLAPTARVRLWEEPGGTGQVELGLKVKPAVIGAVLPGALKVNGELPLFTIVTVCGLSALVLPTAVEAKLSVGASATSISMMEQEDELPQSCRNMLPLGSTARALTLFRGTTTLETYAPFVSVSLSTAVDCGIYRAPALSTAR